MSEVGPRCHGPVHVELKHGVTEMGDKGKKDKAKKEERKKAKRSPKEKRKLKKEKKQGA